tara:strand:+ start:3345 stop:4235 length:891 start_codon:yes stop_codon:yes gene_type:complete
MYVYWGGVDSGKAHLKHYAMLNNKTNLLWDLIGKYIKKIYTTIHHYESNWRDETIHRIIYHNINGLRKCEKKENRIYQFQSYAHKSSAIDPKNISHGIRGNKRKGYSTDDIKKYTQIEYINTNIYFDIISKHVNQICQNMDREILDYDDIFKDVDLLTFIPPEYVIQDNINLFQSSINIVPYKSNKIDSIISKLDGFADFHPHLEYNVDLLDLYNTDKNRVWDWLDEFNRQEDNIITLLKKYNIPYRMFDLDNDRYKDVFGWEIELPNNYTHRKNSWQNNDRYAIVQDIAREYVQR